MINNTFIFENNGEALESLFYDYVPKLIITINFDFYWYIWLNLVNLNFYDYETVDLFLDYQRYKGVIP